MAAMSSPPRRSGSCAPSGRPTTSSRTRSGFSRSCPRTRTGRRIGAGSRMSSQASKAAQLARTIGEVQGGELRVGGVPFADLTALGGSPFYVYSGDVIERRVRAVQEALGPQTQVFFSLKANPSL